MAKKIENPKRNSRFVVAKAYFSAISITLLVGGAVAGAVFGVRPLQNRTAMVLDRGALQIRFSWPAANGGGTWLPQACKEQLLALAKDAAGESSDILEPTQLSQIAAAMEQSGWFASAPKVTRKPGGVIEVNGAWRVPAANVRFRDQNYLVSWDGTPMPPGVETTTWVFDPAVGPPRDRAGERDYAKPWAGEDMAASLELLERIAKEPWSKQVKGVDASQYSNKGTLVLVTDNSTRVVWGGRPKKPSLGEISTAQKMEHIRQLVKDTKRIDANYPIIYVNQERLQFDISATAMARRQSEKDGE